ncbi:alpha/beta fold hydrolase [Actinokineospora iranica]|uniref:Pimeloyl-ACP methyl ester carboxylesterase n=1 Tax=Actinokineospora iranica TaxID=1271860 RepID=A0A1G6U862_9PSEU|nr:alpha/beta hydrolase [Actinokineospora iranica]SDD36777.1 Pimeloyl-ACP methyl ester carboxylesterase [Actinokineospora iranica]
MPLIRVNGIRLHYRDTGSGDPVLLLMGTGGSGSVWDLHQVPALVAAGYRPIAVDNRGIPPSDECADGFTVHDMVADTAGLIEALGLGSCRMVGTSMGAYIAAELALARPDLVRQAALLAARGRSDVLRTALAAAERDLRESGIDLPARYRAAMRAVQFLSRTTLSDDTAARDWLDLLELSAGEGPGVAAQQGLEPMPDRLAAYAAIRVPVRVVSFSDDVIAPPGLGAELAAAIPGAESTVIPDCGHYGYLEDPESVNKVLIDFFAAVSGGPSA